MISTHEGKLIPFKRSKMTDKPVVIDSFDHVTSPEGWEGFFYVLQYPDKTQRMAYLFWSGGKRDYNLLVFIKKGSEQFIGKDSNGKAKIKGDLGKYYSVEENADDIREVIMKRDGVSNPVCKKKAESNGKVHRPGNKQNGARKGSRKKLANG